MKANPLQSIPTTRSTPAEWISFFDALRGRYGKDVAIQFWTMYWNDRGTDDANTSALRSEMGERGVSVQTDSISSALDSIKGVAGGIGDYVGDLFQVGKYAAYGIVAVGLLAVAGLAYGLISNPEKYSKAAGTAAKAMAI